MKLNEIKKILKCNQEELFAYNYLQLKQYNFKKIITTKEYIYAVGNIPILLVAHLDIVHKNTPKEIYYDNQKKVMWSPTGIGGDDRCGTIAIQEILRSGLLPSILFTTDEEIGCVGASVFCKKEELEPVRFALEIDRRGNNQAVFYDCGNKKLQEYIVDKFGFDLEYGSFTDVCSLGETFDIGIVNVSAGYYNEHTAVEYINFKHLYNTIYKIKKILKDADQTYYDYQETFTYDYSYYTYSKSWPTYQDKEKKKYTFLEEEDYDYLTEEQWKEAYGYDKPKNKQELYEKIVYYYDDFYDE